MPITDEQMKDLLYKLNQDNSMRDHFVSNATRDVAKAEDAHIRMVAMLATLLVACDRPDKARDIINMAQASFSEGLREFIGIVCRDFDLPNPYHSEVNEQTRQEIESTLDDV